MASAYLDTLLNDIKVAMKERNQDVLVPLRTLHAQIKDATSNAGKEPTDEAVIAVVARALKQLNDSATQFRQAGREDLAAQADREIALYNRYKPVPLDAAALESLVREVIAETGATTKKEMGRVMQAATARAAGRADGRVLSQLVGSLLK